MAGKLSEKIKQDKSIKEIGDKYLPIGTIVLLKGGTKKVMIDGFCFVPSNNLNKVYDYCGCIYPEGNVNAQKTLMFDHEQIETIYYKGYINEEEDAFKKRLKESLVVSNLKNANDMISKINAINKSKIDIKK